MGSSASTQEVRCPQEKAELMECATIDEFNARTKQWTSDMENMKVKVLVLGQSGAGKSTFINSFLGLKPSQKGAAAVGSNETTHVISEYNNPSSPKLLLYDAPGVGTSTWPRNTYISKLAIDQYDSFILMVSYPRIKEDDLWLFNELQNRGKYVFLVRSRFDADLEDSIQNETGKSPQQVRGDLVNYVREEMRTSHRIYITGRAKNSPFLEEDFSELIKDIFQSLPDRQSELFISELALYTEQWLDVKEECLKAMIPRYSAASGAAGAIPLPGVSTGVGIAADAAIVTGFVFQAKHHFGITMEMLQQRGIDSGAISKFIATRSLVAVAAIGTSIAAEEAAKAIAAAAAVPSLGISLALASLFGASVSFGAMFLALTTLLSDIRGAVRKLMAGEEIE